MRVNVSYSNRSKTVEGSKSLFRIRVGDYRILYEYLTKPRRYVERKK